MPVPPLVRKAATSVLEHLPDAEIIAFDVRLERWVDDLIDGLSTIYGADRAEALAADLVGLAAEAYRDRDPALKRLDLRRLVEPDWLQSPRMFGYATYTQRFSGTLTGMVEKIDYLTDLGVTYLHLMPLLKPRVGDNDGGYAVQDYRTVRASMGTIEDLHDLATELRKSDISLVVDLVLNHVALEHEWAVKARAGDPVYRDYFYVYPDRTIPDQYEQSLPEVFPDFAPGNFTWDDDLDGWVWSTFNSFQWDVNWSNPAVLREYVDIILFLANVGVEVLRLDAIAFMWKRLGTACQNQPEVHAITEVLRAVARMAAPALAFKAEAIVGPRDLVQYLGQGRYAGRLSDLAYHNSLMVQVWSMLATGEVRLAAHALGNLPATPVDGTWICYSRCHDDIGWAIDDGDAGAIGVNGWAHRSFLADWYSGRFAGSPARGLVFQHNPETGDRRISGTAASLCGLESATTEAEVNLALARIFLSNAIVAGWGGIPVIWSGDELGLVNDPVWFEQLGHETDNRWAHRPRFDPVRAADRHDLTTTTGKIFQGIVHLSSTRRGLPQLHASADTTVMPVHDLAILAVAREHASGHFVGLYNVSDQWRAYPVFEVHAAGITDPFNALTGDRPTYGDGVIWLAPYAAAWLVEYDGPHA